MTGTPAITRRTVQRHQDDPRCRGFVYRCFAADGSVLYVGRTARPPERRFQEHSTHSAWWPQVATIDLIEVVGQWIRDFEREQIATDRPLHNRQHHPDWRSTGVLYERVAS